MRKIAARLVGSAISLLAHLITAVRGIWRGIDPVNEQRVYYANHNSNADTVLLWTVLPTGLRARTRPVAAADYWNRSPLRRFVGHDVFNAVLIERDPARRTDDPVTQMATALDDGSSLIIFPEGTRNTTDAPLLPFKSGLFHLASARPNVDFVPVWIANLNKVMPKGEVIPVPLICTVTFGAPIRLLPDDTKDTFLDRTRSALMTLSEAE